MAYSGLRWLKVSVCAPLCCKNMCHASRSCTGGREAGVQGEIIYPPPPFRPEDLCQRGGGGGVYLEAPRGRILYPPPLFYMPPTPRRVFSRVGVWGCINLVPYGGSRSKNLLEGP